MPADVRGSGGACRNHQRLSDKHRQSSPIASCLCSSSCFLKRIPKITGNSLRFLFYSVLLMSLFFTLQFVINVRNSANQESFLLNNEPELMFNSQAEENSPIGGNGIDYKQAIDLKSKSLDEDNIDRNQHNLNSDKLANTLENESIPDSVQIDTVTVVNRRKTPPNALHLRRTIKEHTTPRSQLQSSGQLFDRGSVTFQYRPRGDKNRLNPLMVGACPSEYSLNAPHDEWFRTNVTQRSPYLDISDNSLPHVLILTPIYNAQNHLLRYFSNICSFDYPKAKLSVVLGEDSSKDKTLDEARKHVEVIRPFFRRVEVLQLKSFGQLFFGELRHAQRVQYARRGLMAKSRNQLLLRAIDDEAWVLWIDSDVDHIPTDIIRRLLAPKKQIIAPNCLLHSTDGHISTYDMNTWRETNESKIVLQEAAPDFLMLEGYGKSKRLILNDLKSEGEVVRVDGVGGCVLLVDADLHRNGLVFPSFIFEHHIETEGLAKMAARMGAEMFGLPLVTVLHS